MSIVLVRADEQGFVSKIEPVQINGEDVPHIMAAIQYEFAALLEAIVEAGSTELDRRRVRCPRHFRVGHRSLSGVNRRVAKPLEPGI